MTDIPLLLDHLIFHALDAQASDIHIQPYPTDYRVRFRCDGVLYDHQILETLVGTQMSARIKVLAQLDVAEKRRPQDGTFPFRTDTHDCDIRVATFPSLYGEKLVLRLLDRTATHRSLDKLGLSSALQAKLIQALSRDSGCIILTGPTGSGKTTTAHALLSTLNAHEKNIVTLEDPIEYVLPGVTQSTIQPQLGVTFEAGLRALLRQDPDVIMVGEIRDPETAKVAIQAALTGHQVISTLHTTDAPGALMRLIHMGCERFLVAAAIQVIVAQRLLRTICSNCRHEVPVAEEQALVLKKCGLELTTLFEGSGCELCKLTGFRGRVGIFEVLVMSSSLRGNFIGGADYDQIAHYAAQEGMQSLFQDASEKLKTGVISYAEWARIALCR